MKKILLLCLGLLITGIKAEEEIVRLDEIVITASDTQLFLELEDPNARSTLLTGKDLFLEGSTTYSRSLRQLPFAAGFSQNENDSNRGVGASLINLRGLSQEATLTLVNGRRAGPFSNVNLLPPVGLSALSINLQPGSSVYGSDAITGSVDIIFDPLDTNDHVSFFYGNNFKGDTRTYALELQKSIAGEEYTLLSAVHYYDLETLFSRDRPDTQTDLTGFGGMNRGSPSIPGNISASGVFGNFIPFSLSSGVEAPTSFSDYEGFNPDVFFYDFREQQVAIPGQIRKGLVLMPTYQPRDGLMFWMEIFYTTQRVNNGLAAAPIDPRFGAFFASPYVNDLVNQTADVDLIAPFYRTFELGPRLHRFETDAFRWLAGHKGRSAEMFWETALLVSRSRQNQTLFDFPSGALLSSQVISGAFNPLARAFSSGSQTLSGGQTLSWDNTQALRQSAVNGSILERNRLLLWDAKAQRDFDLFSSVNLNALVGIELREEGVEIDPDSVISDGDALGFRVANAFEAKNQAFSLFTENRATLLESDEHDVRFSISARHERHGARGLDPESGEEVTPTYTTTDYRLMVTYDHTSGFFADAGYGTAFRSPRPAELFIARGTLFSTLPDPLGFPDTDGGFGVEFGGNPELEPETARSYNAGAGYRLPEQRGPLLRIAFTQINTKNAITDGALFFLTANANTQGAGFPDTSGGDVVTDPGADFADRIIRASSGEILQVISENANIAERNLRSLDLYATYDYGVAIGLMGVDLTASRILRWDLRRLAESAAESRLGRFVDPSSDTLSPGSIPKWKLKASLRYSRSEWLEAQLTLDYISGLSDDPNFLAPGVDSHRIESWLTINLAGRYEIREGVTLDAGINNLFNNLPPVSVGAFNDNYDTSLYSIRGRYLYLRLRYGW